MAKNYDQADKTYKFTTNILAKSRHRTRDVRQLKNITPDTQVSYSRILISIGLSVVLVTMIGGAFSWMGPRAPYMALPTIIIGLMGIVLIVLFILPSRQKSLLTSVGELFMFWFGERSRRALSTNAAFNSVGIDKVENGVIYFANGDVGLMYDVEGQISFSVLPVVANATAEERKRYLVARADTTKEMLLTSVRRADVRSKLDNLKGIYAKAKSNPEPWAEWVQHYSNLCYTYIDENMGLHETQIFQVVILRETTATNLDRARATFENACYNGMYAHIQPVSDDGEIADRLRALTMLSEKGFERIGGRSYVATGVTENDEPTRAERVAQAEEDAYNSGADVIVYSDENTDRDDSVESLNTRAV